MFEENTRRTVQLTDDDTFGPVNHKRPIRSHERDFAKVNFLLLDVFDAARARLIVHVPQDQLHRYF